MEHEIHKGMEAIVEQSGDNRASGEVNAESNVHSPASVTAKDGCEFARRRISTRGIRGSVRSPYYSPTRSSAMSPVGNGEKGDQEKEEGEGAAEPDVVPDIDVIPRYRSHPNRSQGSFSHLTYNVHSPAHSRMSSYERISWDSQAWKDVFPENAFLGDQSKDLLRLPHSSMDFYHGSPTQQCRKHVRSLATWGKVEGDGSPELLATRNSSPMRPAGCQSLVSTLDALPEPIYETAPLGHQHCFSLSSRKDAAYLKTEAGGEATAVNNEAGEQPSKGPAMTHVLVVFKSLYGVYYVPEAQWGTIGIGDLVSVESHSGENTGKVICDLTHIMSEASHMRAEMAQCPRHVLWPEDASAPLETINPKTNEEVLQRLPRVLRRGMNKGKKRLYYARRRENEALDVGNRLVRDRNFNLALTGVEYQVDFKRITVFCKGDRSHVDPSEVLIFSQQLASSLRGSIVSVVFANEIPERLDVTGSITKAAFQDLYTDALAKIKEAESAQPQRQASSSPVRQSTTAAGRPHNNMRASHIYPDPQLAAMNHTPLMPFFGVPPPFSPPVAPGAPPLMNAVGMNGLYGMTGVPPMNWGVPTPPPYIPPHLPQNVPGRM
ncbi:hypothetical protein, conserved [Trypanosoma brucei gambiense DAL972]|uniref:PSP1 C-terminal domain-containing protein n=1 Tax=Trypanosoma brucei gambiense (strain MHOM/CI/86/DAL972) TaxID=679716 RepID=D0A453_TRYB9|nr:hypothetical protein, conserved [Trypanosoma brucei gambiense DAL972]CBH16047.1 hypothetical protein, conserved [Trypanosoma brucei gambiense DAL972]|eukprot:XP_011778311.1 hypothetical protein, conserved [Trypanosoma brucei gambiense DAL972]